MLSISTQDISFLFDGGYGDGGIKKEFADVSYLHVEGEGVGVAAVSPHCIEDCVTFNDLS